MYVGRKVNERRKWPACPVCAEEQRAWAGVGWGRGDTLNRAPK